MDEVIQFLDTENPLIEEVEASDEVGLTDDEIRALCEEEYRKAKPTEEILAAQKLALQQYFLDPDGNEEQGSSQVQDSTVRDSIEAALPILMDMFLSSDSPVIFRPSHEKDIEQAELETVFCQYVLLTQNPGILILLQWIKEALLLKNGYVKVFWDALVNEEREDYAGVSADELAAMMADDDYEVIEVGEVPTLDASTMQPTGEIYYNVSGKRRSDAGQVRIINIPTDRVRIAASWNSINLDGCPYVCHEEPCTRSDLLVDGFDPELIESLPTENYSLESSDVSLYRRDMDEFTNSTNSSDPSRDVLRRFEHYIRADRNGDGITELLKVTIIGENGGTVLDIEEVDGHAIIPTTPFILPHSSTGLSLAEFVGETQRIQTAVLRQTLDNLYLSNQPGTAINVNNITNPEVLTEPKVGRIYLKKTGENIAETIGVPFMAEKSLLVMQAIDQKAEKKTGLSAETIGLDAESLAKSTNFVGGAVLNLSQLRMKLVMTTLCETGFKPLMLRVRELCMKNMSRKEMVELAGKWVPIDPRNWREKRDTQIRVGVGSVMKAERQAVLQQIIGLQEKIVATQGGIEGPFVTGQNIYNSLCDVERLTGTANVNRYFSDPANYTPPPEKPDVATEALEIEQAKLAEKAQKDAADIELKHRELNIKEREVGIKQEQVATARINTIASNLVGIGDANAT
ncbi:portal protein [Agrobacterium tumefaciens]|uniref:Phage portal protein n=1 Tax=Agrobacterium tumefaciens TaxID=358 RepID=A0A176WXE0_AGRTU|nr:hypothetical protein [Agrobacterium tumefaciens]OAE37648.1 hypothetical protein A7J57_08705 [Agrobacterium tumefaciens]